MRPLIIDEEAKQNIARVLAYAEKHKYTKDQMVSLMNGIGTIPGDDPGFCCRFRVGFRAVFCIEEQPFGWSKHLSVSVDNPKKAPHEQAVRLLMQEFGISTPLEECHVWLEEGPVSAVNVIARG